MVRSYRKYEAVKSFATVSTSTSNIVWSSDGFSTTTSKTKSGKSYVGANEEVLCWDIKTGELLSRWRDKDNRAVVTCLVQCIVQPDLVAAGYDDGSIRVWDALSGQVVVSFNGHRSAVTQIQFDQEGARLASGSRDTDIIVWNLLSETAEYRLRGHKDQITGLAFIQSPVPSQRDSQIDEGLGLENDEHEKELEERYLISTSKDALVKIWDIATPHCIETHMAQTSGECWALGLSPDGAGCITAGSDGELRVWQLDLDLLSNLADRTAEGKKQDILTSQGTLHRQGRDRALGITFHPKQDYFAVHGPEKAVELWRIRSPEEVRRQVSRRKKRRREKAANDETSVLEQEEDSDAVDINILFTPYVVVRTGGKVRSIDWANPRSRSSRTLQLAVGTTNNQLEMFSVMSFTAQQKSAERAGEVEYSRSLAVELPGHRSDIRTLSLSSDDRMLASASLGQLKIWNMRTQSCLRTLECGQALCSAFLPGDRIVLVGTKTGELELYDISTSTLIESIKAHDGSIWTLAVHPDGRSAVTGSADKTAKFWRFDIIDEEVPGTRRTTQRLKLSQTRELKVQDDILAISISPDSRLLALSTLDNTVKVFFIDSLKLFLTLYGHKLPVLSLSISSDSKVIATSSADKMVRIWGLDFGDCHKAFFAHQDSVMAVSFIPHPVEGDEKHILFSVSKDGVVKSWDGDKFEQIQKLEGHHGEIWSMVVSRTGETVVTASHDKSIRTWEVGDDLVFLEEERERELEEMYESTLAHNLDRDAQDEAAADEEVAAASKRTIATMTHGEKLLEAVDLAIVDLELMRVYHRDRQHNPNLAPPPRNPLFLALGDVSAEQHVLHTLRKIPPAALHDALLVVPFAALPNLFTFLALFLRHRTRPDLAWRVAYFLLQVHMQQLVASRQLRAPMQEIYEAYDAWQADELRVMGFNLAGLTLMARDAREVETGRFLGDAGDDEVEDVGKGRKKRAFASVA